MIYTLSIIILLLLFIIYKMNRQIISISKQIEKKEKIRISLSNKNIEKLASQINKKDKESWELQLKIIHEEEDLKRSIANITHDLRTPLTSISGYLELIKTKEKNFNKKYINIIENKTNELIDLTEQLFSYSKTLDLMEKPNLEKTCINELLEETIISYYTIFQTKGIIPNISISNKKIIKNVDKQMLTRIFENIISNAIKYSRHDLDIVLSENGIITFSNTTLEFEKKDVTKLFDRYYTINSGKHSNGIGLSIAKQLSDLNNILLDAKYKDEKLIIRLKFNK